MEVKEFFISLIDQTTVKDAQLHDFSPTELSLKTKIIWYSIVETLPYYHSIFKGKYKRNEVPFFIGDSPAMAWPESFQNLTPPQAGLQNLHRGRAAGHHF